MMVNQRARFTACDGDQQLRRPLHGAHLVVWIDTALEAHRRVRMHAVLTGHAGHGFRGEKCRLEKYVTSVVGHRRRQAAHDPGHADRARIVAYDERIRQQFDLLLVQQDEFLARVCEPRPDRPV